MVGPVSKSMPRHGFAGRCGVCGKLRFLTRKDARAFARSRFPNAHMNAYMCGGYFHIGHLSRAVLAGRASRAGDSATRGGC